MGHATSAVTLDVYTDSNLETVYEEMMLLQKYTIFEDIGVELRRDV